MITLNDLRMIPFRFTPSYDQLSITEYVLNNPRQNVSVHAVAGAGKTSLLSFIDTARHLYTPERYMVCLTYSKRLSEDMKELIHHSGSVSTTHSYLFKMLTRYARNNGVRYVGVDDNVSFYVAKNMANKYYGIAKGKKVPQGISVEYWSMLRTVEQLSVDIRKNMLNISKPEEILEWCRANNRYVSLDDVHDGITAVKALTHMFLKKGRVDFLGQLYLPHVLNGFGKFVRHPDIVAVDECNDSYRLLREAYKLVVGPETQVILTGDEKQTIHMWAGAESNCFSITARLFNSQPMTYSTSYRISKAVCNYLNDSQLDTRVKVPSSAPQGVLTDVNYSRFILDVREGDSELGVKPDMVLCRYNRGSRVENTLEKVSIDLLSLGKAVILLGSTYIDDIKFIINVIDTTYIKPFRISDAVKAAEECVAGMVASEEREDSPRKYAISEWKRQVAVFRMYFHYYERKTVKKERSLTHFIRFCEKMYDEEGSDAIVLSSIHKAKGRQAERVYILHLEALEDAIYFGETLDERIEALNLTYVALTRAQRECYVVGAKLPTSFPTKSEIENDYRKTIEGN